MSAINYQFLNHIDAPKRILTLTLDEVVVAGLGFLLLIVSNQKVLVALFSFGLLSGLRLLKKGQGPRVLLVLAWWHLPHGLTRFFLPDLPASHYRIWVA
ncbi:type IV conjugative transfer system protein TraL (plasmid) [Legionella geestiana]|nr:type IV conjugative transfer system protein TraL [Legionella geestiana]